MGSKKKVCRKYFVIDVPFKRTISNQSAYQTAPQLIGRTQNGRILANDPFHGTRRGNQPSGDWNRPQNERNQPKQADRYQLIR